MTYFAIFGKDVNPSITLRGLGLVNFSDSWEAPVSTYTDGVYIGNPSGSAVQLFDLERVEVLRGPQGTIYGRNTTGGLVHHISKKPTDELDAGLSIQLGQFNERIFQGFVSGPLGNAVRGRLAVKSNTADGWQTNTFNGNDLSTTDTLGYRAQLEFDLSDSATLLLNVHGSTVDQQQAGFTFAGYLEDDLVTQCSVVDINAGRCRTATAGLGQVSGLEATGGLWGPEFSASSESDIPVEIDTFGASATLNWGFDNFELISITAYEELDKFTTDDADGTEAIWFDERYNADDEQFTQEIRLQGGQDRLYWVAGLYYYDESRKLQTAAPINERVFATFHREGVDLDTESVAVFGQIEYKLSDQLTLQLGGRYTDESKDFAVETGPSFFAPVNGTLSLSEDAITGRIGLDWHPNENTLVYGNVSTGFKSGGFNGSFLAAIEAAGPVTAEDIVNFELGWKTSLADGRVSLNTALFAYEVSDYQVQVFQDLSAGSFIRNAGDVNGTGLEIELAARVTENFELILGAGYLDTEFDSPSSLFFTVAGVDYTLDGNTLQGAPELSFNGVARYSINNFAFQIDYAWQDDQFLQTENDPFSLEEAYGIANAKISWTSDDSRYTFEAFVKNLANEEYRNYQNTLGSDWGIISWGRVRSSGVRFIWKM
jgi:iron complex outermembrane receptor protein